MKSIRILIALLIIIIAISIAGCADKKMSFDTLEISASDQIDVPVGAYTIPYTIANLEYYKENLGVAVNIMVYDEEDNLITVTDGAIIIEIDRVYTVTIIALDSKGGQKTKTFTLTAVIKPIIIYTVTYDLRGASQQDIITQEVSPDELATVPTIIPTKDAYIFTGWYKDINCVIPWNFDTDRINNNVTIYAGWELVYSEWTGDYLYEDLLIMDSSIIDNYSIIHRVECNVKYNHFSDGAISESGIVYSLSNNNPKIRDEGVIRKTGGFTKASSQYSLTTYSLGLLSNSKYYMRAYIISADVMVDSEVTEYTTINLVPMGGQVGCNYVVSGGVYYIDNGDMSSLPYKYIEIDEAYRATIDGNSFNGGNGYFNSGQHILITTEIATGRKYLHIFDLHMIMPQVELALVEVNYSSEWLGGAGIKVTYGVTSKIDYVIEEAGILYSTTNMLLEMGYPETNITSVYSYDSVANHYMNSNQILVIDNNPDLYIRGYYKSSNRYSYSQYVTKLVWEQLQDMTYGYVIDSHYKVEDIHAKEYTFYTSAQAEHSVTKIYPSIEAEEVMTGEFTLDQEGIYRVYNTSENIIYNVNIDKSSPVVLGVLSGIGPVIPICTEANAVMYLIKDGGEEMHFASGVRITEKGNYILKVYDSISNYEEIVFNII